jgi:HAD superfamily hydrolase (TIGR01509 family)
MVIMRTLFDTPSFNTPAEPLLAEPVPPVEAVLFDFANTIFHMIEIDEWLRRIAADTGQPDLDVTGAAAQLADAYTRPEIRAAQADRDLSPANHRRSMYAWFAGVDALRGLEDVAYARMIADDSWVPYPDTEPVLRALDERGIPVGVVSDIAWDIRAHVRPAGLEKLIDTYALSYERGCEKPDPDLFRFACASLRTDPRRTLMVGDNPARDGGATTSGLRAYILPAEHRTGERGLAPVLTLVD